MKKKSRVEARALIDRVRRADSQDLDEKEREIEAEQSALRRQMEVVKRQRAAITLQKRERTLREEAKTHWSLRDVQIKEETEKRIAELKVRFGMREEACEARRVCLRAKMDEICKAYEIAVREAKELRVSFDEACERVRLESAEMLDRMRNRDDEAIRQRIEAEARELGFALQKVVD